VVEDGLRAYIPAVRRLVLDTIAAGGELLINTISLILIQLEKSFLDVSDLLPL